MNTPLQLLCPLRIRLALVCVAAGTLACSGRALTPLAEQLMPDKLAQVLLPMADWRPVPPPVKWLIAPRVETIRLDDERLIKSRGATLGRLTFGLEHPGLEGVLAVRIVPTVSAR